MIVLMTGASGAAGAALLDRLCRTPGIERIYALVHRAPLAHADPRIRACRGSMTDGPSLGLDHDTHRQILAETTAILHAAADTRFDGPEPELRVANVDGTTNVLHFARRARAVDRIAVLSTVYVAGRRTGRVLESDAAHDAGFVNAYERSKYDMEAVIAAHARELPISVIRLSTVVGDSRDGRVLRQAAFHHALRLFYQSLAPMLPGVPGSPVDLIALDYATDAVATLLCREFRPGARHHVCAADDAPTIDDLLDRSVEAFLASRPAWRRRAIARPAIVPLSAFERFADSVEALEDATLSSATRLVRPFAPQLAYPKRFDDEGTQASLARHGVRRPPFASYFPKVVDHLINEHWREGRRGVPA